MATTHPAPINGRMDVASALEMVKSGWISGINPNDVQL